MANPNMLWCAPIIYLRVVAQNGTGPDLFGLPSAFQIAASLCKWMGRDLPCDRQSNVPAAKDVLNARKYWSADVIAPLRGHFPSGIE
jgi:hypothetical protein